MPGGNLEAVRLIVEGVEEGDLPHFFDRLRWQRSCCPSQDPFLFCPPVDWHVPPPRQFACVLHSRHFHPSPCGRRSRPRATTMVLPHVRHFAAGWPTPVPAPLRLASSGVLPSCTNVTVGKDPLRWRCNTGTRGTKIRPIRNSNASTPTLHADRPGNLNPIAKSCPPGEPGQTGQPRKISRRLEKLWKHPAKLRKPHRL